MSNEQTQMQAQKRPMTMTEYKADLEKKVFSDLQTATAGALALPKNYSAPNAFQSAMLAISQVVDRDKRPALQVCTPESVRQAITQTILQGLNPDKKQCYYIVFGQKLTMLTSYFGEVAKAKAVDPNIQDVYAEIVYAGDKFQYAIKRGVKVITVHEQAPENVKLANIIGAYATIVYKDGTEKSDYMTKEQINNSWSRGQTKGQSDAHKLAPEEMSKKTVLRRLCKAVYNTSDDSELDMAAAIAQEADANQNSKVIDVTPADAPVGIQQAPATIPAPKADADGVVQEEPEQQQEDDTPLPFSI